MSAVLRASDLTLEDLLPLIGQLKRPSDAPPLRCWIEAPDGWAFSWWPGLEGQLLWCQAGQEPKQCTAAEAVQRSMAGRLFAKDGELRWRVLPALEETPCRCVFLGHREWEAALLSDQSQELSALTVETRRYLLWGQQTEASPGEWIELRIPHRFRYPLQDSPRGVVVETERWLDATYQPQFVRLCDLQPYSETD